jgi:transcriptional regulator with GAF, ATPase, and Fis domain/energy-coupling factor transporter ATP-binding protein EcfA2
MDFPVRYEKERQLGEGGGGAVWAVRDRLSGKSLALKTLHRGAGAHELAALLREATALSGLEGLGVPRVVAFGTLATGERYMVRELIAGRSLQSTLESRPEGGAREWFGPLVDAADQLTVLHRAGLLHGDVKPANIIVDADGHGRLVDLGLSAPFLAGGTEARGLTPRFAAPELLAGQPLTVRAEVFALGASLDLALEHRAARLGDREAEALFAIADRATRKVPGERYPSVDELAMDLRSAIGVPPSSPRPTLPVLGLEQVAAALLDRVAHCRPGERLDIVGPAGSGRSTLLRRLAWSIGAQVTSDAHPTTPERKHAGVAHLECADLQLPDLEALERLLESPHDAALTILVDDAELLSPAARERLEAAQRDGAVVVAVATRASSPTPFVVPPLEFEQALELVRMAAPSLGDRVARYWVDKAERRPGILRHTLAQLADRVIASTADVDELFAAHSMHHAHVSLDTLRLALRRGRIREAAALVDQLVVQGDEEALEVELARGRIALSRGELAHVDHSLAQAHSLRAKLAERGSNLSLADATMGVVAARLALRRGDYASAVERALAVRGADGAPPALEAEARAIGGLAAVFQGDDATGARLLRDAVSLAEGDARALGLAWGSLAIAEQRGGRNETAKTAYLNALNHAERAEDAWNIAATRLNLGTLLRTEGDLAPALEHFSAAIDMGERAGAEMCVTEARLNLANVDMYLGRYARAQACIEALARQKARLTASTRANLLGLEGEYRERTGAYLDAAVAYTSASEAYDALGRSSDATEMFLEALLCRLHAPPGASETPASLLASYMQHIKSEQDGDEHLALALMVHGALKLALGDETSALSLIERAVRTAREQQHGEWTWRALALMARAHEAQGASGLAARAREEALLLLEQVASRLPRDLREVFWSDARRKALREGQRGATSTTSAAFGLGASGTSNLASLNGRLPAEDRLARLFEITRELARARDLLGLLESVTDHAIAIVGAERGFVVLVDEDGQLGAHTARGPRGEATQQTFSRSVAQQVVDSGEAVVSQSAMTDERLKGAASVHQLAIQSIACVPIRGVSPRGETIGALYLETRKKGGARFQHELPMLQAFADQAAVAIENRRLIAQNEARAEELQRKNVELERAQERLSDILGRRTEQLAATRRDLRQARSELRGHFGYGGLVGTSEAMRRVYAVIERVKDADVPVLLTGESGAGKEVVAKAIHTSGERKKGPFIGVNCGAIPTNLLESELFGHEKGSFTGADRDHKGLIRQADGGTILLDEVGELPLNMQTALLRVLQERTVRPIGAAAESPVDVRILAATNRDLREMVQAGTFREDLYYRLHVVELRVPSLRERADDIPMLVDHFISLFSARYRRERKSLTREAQRVLMQYAFPGNVRQLEHVLLNAWLMSDGDEIEVADLALPTGKGTRSDPAGRRSEPRASRPPPSSIAPPPTSAPVASTKDQFRDAEKERILQALTSCQWNRVQAARILDMPRRTFYRRLKEYGIL